MNTSGPVDIVYLWVDGSDAVWRSKRRVAQQELDAQQRQQIAAYGDVEGRFRDNEELRYSLRALDRFFPDHAPGLAALGAAGHGGRGHAQARFSVP